MRMPPQVYLFLLGSLVFYAGGEYVSKLYSLNQNCRLFMLAVFMYAVNSALWLPALSAGKSLTIVSTIWNLSYMMTAPFIGLVLFREGITGLQGLGLVLGFVAMILMSL